MNLLVQRLISRSSACVCARSGLGPHDDTTLLAHPDILLDLLTRTRELNQAHKNLMDYRTDLGVNVMKQMRTPGSTHTQPRK